MLTFKPAQLETLQANAANDFRQRAIRYLRQAHPQAGFVANDASVARFVEAVVAKAAEYDVSREIDVMRLTDVFIAIGGNFESNPQFCWVADYLREPVRAEFRLDRICERLRFSPQARLA